MNTRILISLIGFGASWHGPSQQTPWSIYLTANGKQVLDGGPYPNDHKDSILLIKDISMDDAESAAKSLVLFLSMLGYDSIVEMIGDA